MIEEKINAMINECNESLLKLASVARVYIAQHDEYTFKNIKDASLLKKKIIEKVVGVFDND
jgi:pyrimidine deaminase RibD-like protein